MTISITTKEIAINISEYLPDKDRLSFSGVCKTTRIVPHIFPIRAREKICFACIQYNQLPAAQLFALALPFPSEALDALVVAHIGRGDLITAETIAENIPDARIQSSALDGLVQIYHLAGSPAAAERVAMKMRNPE